MTTTQVVWLTRHGNRQDFVDPGWRASAERPFDPGLSPDGIEQARKVAGRLQGEGITHVFASPYLRTVETAHYIAEVLDRTIYLEPGIGEWLNPEWMDEEPERLPERVLQERFPRVDLDYTPRLVPEYPETVDEALARAGRAARRVAAAYPGTILLVGHGISVTGGAMGLVESEHPVECALCALFKAVRRDPAGPFELALAGDVSHLDHAEAADRLF